MSTLTFHSLVRPSAAGVFAALACCCIATFFAPLAMAEPGKWRAEGWKTDFSRTTVDLGEILSGGPPKDAIPAIDEPRFRPVAEIDDLTDKEPVVSLSVGADARAYPRRILIWHEIVNDVVGGKPVAVIYCPLCNSAVVFERKVDKTTLDFGTTGKLRHSALVMYDRQTESWWQQFTDEAITGAMVGKTLEVLPAGLEAFGDFKARRARGRVLVPNDPSLRRYGENPYVGYDTAERPFLFRGELPTNINPMARVVAVRDGGTVHAVSLALLREKKAIDINGIRLTWQDGQASALDSRRLAKGRDVGTVVATRQDGGGMQADVPYDVTFAFAFHAFHPDIDIRQK